ncbi:pentraxin fusion protein-like [Nematostella vectensis]|uniref:pentraxin fusion protein-like n=1 Tax=Nematostella vectensis TaxID=45351 RepID=UPI0020774515|nr:pentraxin fusion protein-like [Nematostella vectensis]
MADAPGWTYKAFEDYCIGNTCGWGTTCQVGYGSLEGYRCKCCFDGAQCTEGNFAAHFPHGSHYDMLTYNAQVIEIDSSFTASAWFKTSMAPSSSIQTIFSVNTQYLDGAFFMRLGSGTIRVRVKSIAIDVDSNDLRNGNWHHFGFTWTRATGDWKIFLNGSETFQGTALAPGYALLSGYFVLGQDQDTYNGGYDPKQGFRGILFGVNMW